MILFCIFFPQFGSIHSSIYIHDYLLKSYFEVFVFRVVRFFFVFVFVKYVGQKYYIDATCGCNVLRLIFSVFVCPLLVLGRDV